MDIWPPDIRGQSNVSAWRSTGPHPFHVQLSKFQLHLLKTHVHHRGHIFTDQSSSSHRREKCLSTSYSAISGLVWYDGNTPTSIYGLTHVPAQATPFEMNHPTCGGSIQKTHECLRRQGFSRSRGNWLQNSRRSTGNIVSRELCLCPFRHIHLLPMRSHAQDDSMHVA